MAKKAVSYLIALLLMTFTAIDVSAQGGIIRRLPRGGGGGAGGAGGGGMDSLEKRDNLQDSITISFRFLDTTRVMKFDSSITDFTKKFPVPWHHFHLGNVGNASKSLIYSPIRKSGWDHGFHAFDIYNFTAEETRLYNTTRPLTEIQYQIGSRLEQNIGLLHTQNITPGWNASFQYQLVNSPGFFRNQNTNHNNYRFGSWYQSKNKRYQNFVIMAANKLQSAENGGIRDDFPYLDSSSFNERSTIPTKLGPATDPVSRNFFANDISTGTRYTNATFLMRQQYDIGQKDSLVVDTLVIPLFYPRLRLEHTIRYQTYNYRFTDEFPQPEYYAENYSFNDTLDRYFSRDAWEILSNDVSFYTFPDAKNSQQFLKAGATVELLNGLFDSATVERQYHNIFIHGEYRNRTRNKKWDVEAYGNLYLSGFNSGDYHARISLKRLISQKIGSLELGFGNVNRTPSFVFNPISSFYLGEPQDFKKENSTELFGSFDIPRLKMKLSGNYHLINNYTYYTNFRDPAQYATLFNLLQVKAEKQIKIAGHWNWRTWLVLQQKTGDAPVNLPLLLTRNQIGYDGNLNFKNLLISFGLEFRYFTPYKADRYSALTGQFVYQEDETIRMRFPDLAAYMHFRIKTFTSYVRLENLNTFEFSTGAFTRNNVVFPDYPQPGMILRIGVYWDFIN